MDYFKLRYTLCVEERRSGELCGVPTIEDETRKCYEKNHIMVYPTARTHDMRAA
jgi:hypothetical protein